MTDEPFTVRRFSDDFARLLRGKILSGELQPGERLNEVHLAEQYGISRSPIREALQALSGEHLVTFVPGKGAFVQELTVDEVRNLGEVREALETHAARLVAERATPEQLDELERSASIGADGNGSEPSSFHRVLFRLAGNPRLEFIGVSTTSRLRLARSRSASDSARVAEATKEHQEIVEALRAGNPDRAATIMRAHIRSATESAASKA